MKAEKVGVCAKSDFVHFERKRRSSEVCVVLCNLQICYARARVIDNPPPIRIGDPQGFGGFSIDI